VKREFTKEGGSVLVMTLVITLVLMILGTVVLNMSLAENKFAIKQEDKLQAYYIARSGAQSIAEYMVLDNHGDAKNIVGTSVANTSIGGGSFTVNVAQDPLNSNVINVVSTATYKNTTQKAKLNVYKTSTGVGGLYNYAIVAKNNITSPNSAGSGTTITGGIATINGSITLAGHVNYGSATENALIMLPEVEIPPISELNQQFGKIDNPLTLPVSGHLPKSTTDGINEYNYYATGIDLKNELISVVDTTGVTPVGSKPNVVVHLYVEGDINIETNAIFNVADHTMLYIYVKGVHTVKLSGNGAQNNVFIYAPDSDIIWNNAQTSGLIFGGLVGNNVTITNHVNVAHNPLMANYSNLNTSNVGITYTGYKWID
jgi:hypothetical protein